MLVRAAVATDFEGIWPVFQAVVAPGDTYAIDPDIGPAAARALWMDAPQRTYVAETADRIVGTAILRPNQAGNGGHVANAAFMVAPEARGRGVAAALCARVEAEAAALGYRAMQFNLVVASNAAAIRLWTRLGYATVGRLPEAFRHPELGYVDALVMMKRLG